MKVVSNCVVNPIQELFCSRINSEQNLNLFNNSTTNPIQDSFVKLDKKQVYLDKLNKLFPNNSLNLIYNTMNTELGIDKPAKMTFSTSDDGITGGGFTYSKNEINLSLEDLLASDTKIVGIKNGKRTILISPSVKLPLFINKEMANQFVELHSKNGNLGFDKLIAEPVTAEEQRKLIIQKIYHEVIHAQQHMIMRKTDDIGSKEISKAWTHIKPNNLIEHFILNNRTDEIFKKSFWANIPEPKEKFNKDSDIGKIAHIWLEGIRNYPAVDSPEYPKNPIELDAYNRSFEYINKKFGGWNA